MADSRIKYGDQEKEMWFEQRRAGKSYKEIGELFGVSIGTISGACSRAGVTKPRKGNEIVEHTSLTTPPDETIVKDVFVDRSEEDGFEELGAAFKEVQSAAVAFVQKRYQELLEQNAELTAKLAETKEECKKLKEAVLEERNNNGDWKERLQSF